ncbi:MAG: SPOR domain-containing protein [Candidatus Azotimanducaceae bacterium WSBS_2022_MAG_OTU7]
MINAIHCAGKESSMNMLMNRILPFILLLVIARSALAENVFWVLGSFVDEAVARVEASRISSAAGIEVLLFKSIVNTQVQYRLLTGAMVEQSDQAELRQQLVTVRGFDPWTLRFEDETPYMETVFSALGTDDALSAAGLAEIDSMLNEFDNEYADVTETSMMDTDTLAEDFGARVDSTSTNLCASRNTARWHYFPRKCLK